MSDTFKLPPLEGEPENNIIKSPATSYYDSLPDDIKPSMADAVHQHDSKYIVGSGESFQSYVKDYDMPDDTTLLVGEFSMGDSISIKHTLSKSDDWSMRTAVKTDLGDNGDALNAIAKNTVALLNK